MTSALPPDPAAVTKLLESLNAVDNAPTIINPKFYMFLVIQNVLYLRVTELFKDQSSLEISAIPLTVQLKSLESDIAMICDLTSPRLAHQRPPQPHRSLLGGFQNPDGHQRRVRRQTRPTSVPQQAIHRVVDSHL
jgi:hypothetical protein